MSQLHLELCGDFERNFDLKFDDMLRHAWAYADIRHRERYPSDGSWDRLRESVQRLHQHIVDNAVFGFELPGVEERYEPLLTAALDFAAVVHGINRILSIPETGPEYGEWPSPALSEPGFEVCAKGNALERAVFDAFGVGEEMPC